MAGWQNVLTTADITTLVTLVQRWDEVPAGILPAPNVPIPVTEECRPRQSTVFFQLPALVTDRKDKARNAPPHSMSKHF